jgi:dTDP-4-dehydrorhamnose 3,5-epimerase
VKNFETGSDSLIRLAFSHQYCEEENFSRASAQSSDCRGSLHFGQRFGLELNAENRRQLWVPEGFVALEDDTHFLYKTTDTYAKDCEGAIRWDDPDLAIAWPDTGVAPKLAPKDAAAPRLSAAVLPQV